MPISNLFPAAGWRLALSRHSVSVAQFLTEKRQVQSPHRMVVGSLRLPGDCSEKGARETWQVGTALGPGSCPQTVPASQNDHPPCLAGRVTLWCL